MRVWGALCCLLACSLSARFTRLKWGTCWLACGHTYFRSSLLSMWNPKISLCSRHLEVVGTRKNGRARRSHLRVSLARARSLFRPLLPSACYAGYPKMTGNASVSTGYLPAGKMSPLLIALTFNFRNSVIYDQFKATWYFNVQGCGNLYCNALFLFTAGKFYH